jgi:hypothetical protein
VENGIHLELPEVSIAVKDQLVHENYTWTGLPLVKKIDALKREAS